MSSSTVWIKCFSKKENRDYWFNQQSGESSWTKPINVDPSLELNKSDSKEVTTNQTDDERPRKVARSDQNEVEWIKQLSKKNDNRPYW